jgi:uncharacterized RDD family membrane protein YckC
MSPQMHANYCSECGRPTAPEELARFGDRLICPNCKNAYAQKLREGAAPAAYVRFGGFWIRFVAQLIDGIILAIPMGILQAVLFASLSLSMARMAPSPAATPEDVFRTMAPMFGMMGLSMLIGLVLGCSYETFFIAKFAATPGKMAFGLKVVRADGTRVDTGRAIGRYFSKMLSAMILYIGYIMAGIDSQKRALHDMMCDTRVIQTRG